MVFSAPPPKGAVMEIFTLNYMVAKQRHEAGKCDAFCSFCYTEAEDYLRRKKLAEEERDCVANFTPLCDCNRCKKGETHAKESTES